MSFTLEVLSKFQFLSLWVTPSIKGDYIHQIDIMQSEITFGRGLYRGAMKDHLPQYEKKWENFLKLSCYLKINL